MRAPDSQDDLPQRLVAYAPTGQHPDPPASTTLELLILDLTSVGILASAGMPS